ncbi:SDR family NAD(P)-dependent oxidoreductase [Rhodovulum sulfidophilum]|uniref:SDR family NAD(P)-dependent oxidoreductase n=1 Tax=Rhodovulum sulfidophilum TaxID=35806 RepID=UPI0005A85E9E|nr:SDR family NAD(P)-dependent oxidoreductase [Rhodovulum sulfidophilum]ANB35262.1 3-hydroxy-2-methylbutyryl-CoA dehydrogenase [Rhodovulum sulfidophilum DSM 1374]ANB39084.1 3-hydroxy-2-methylbutyryl-CoA dehydrogenase [Rhodovulum sulfidophilum]MBK5923125.1 3-hydroxyacyl-CoA dehydrogenase [Rhodovulum sulfidophilum]MBL3551569.1 SDR family NAD(P)-dependent oxidoreductase [Rhodovulum sulfidophilum]MBL3564399.1 SDR family NAD(P)-dependent oxidoreductase [Rhodovulum sulfidophilum]
MQISETRAIVTGAASGLGAATARRLCAAEAAVTILDRDTERGMELAAEIGAGFQPVDVTDEPSVEQAIGEASAQMGGITACINCAGIATAERTLDRSGPHGLESFRRTVEINLIGSFNVLRLAAAEMAQNAPDDEGCRGVIVNTASVAAYDGQEGQAAYAASKGAIAAMTLPLARDLAGLRIRVMTIAPGLFRTPMQEGPGEADMDGLAANVPNPPRLGDPAEYAALVLHILQNGYLNGEVIRLDAGLRMG